MHRLSAGLAAAALLFTTACESPQGNGVEDQLGSDTVRTDTSLVDTGTISDTATVGNGPDRSGEEDADGEIDRAGPGVALQTILDQAFEREPETQDLVILERLHDPQSVDLETQPNRHVPDQTDTLRTLNYQGLELTIHIAGDKEILENVTVTGKQYETEDGLSVGMSRNELETLRGRPERRQDGTYVYNLGGELPTVLQVGFSGDEVTRLEWQYPID